MADTADADVEVPSRAVSPWRPSAGRSLAVIGITAALMLVADAVVSQLVVFAMFLGVTPLVGIPFVAVLLIVAIALVGKKLTGKAPVAGAIVVTMLLSALGAYGFLNGILAPITLGGSPVHFLTVALSAVALGLFLGPLMLRLLGAAAAVSAVVLPAVQPTSADRARAQSEAAAAERDAENLHYFLTEGTFPVVTDLDGWRNARVRATGAAADTWLVSDAGAVATVYASGPVDGSAIGTAACGFLIRPGEADSPTPDAYPDWCVQTDEGWSRSDGTAVAYVIDDDFVVLDIADDVEVGELDGTRPASAADIEHLAGTLRPMTRAEVDEYLVDVYRAGDTPAVDTPGL
ncbi:hypothetical protein AAIB33_13225 [Microbacterium sp. AZCO]|uniref:hypothetical protein n=1 Tax=Microbacterium sp. AZCO TaxID=3142976 RepID=UPI0031F3A128